MILRLSSLVFAISVAPLAFCISSSEIPSDTPVNQLVSSANALLAQGNFNDALTYFDVAITRDPTNYLTLFKRGATYLSMGKNNLAGQDFDKVLEIKPDFEGALLQKAKLDSKLGDWAGAKKFYSLAGKKKGPEVTELEEAQGAAVLAIDAEKKKDWEGCVAQADVAIKIASSLGSLRKLRARCRFERGEIHEGVGDLAHVLQLHPRDIDTHIQMSAYLYYSLGDTERGLTQIRRCLHQDPDSKACSKVYKRERAYDKEMGRINKLFEKKQWNSGAKLLVPTGEDAGLIQDVRDEVKDFQLKNIINEKATSDLLATLLEMTCEAYSEVSIHL
jgi:DnaJ homolog subfamily C member 3